MDEIHRPGCAVDNHRELFVYVQARMHNELLEVQELCAVLRRLQRLGYFTQDFGFSVEHSFTTGPEPGSEETVKLLAIADLGFCEEDGSMTAAGNYPNNIATLPVGTQAEIKQEVSLQSRVHWVICI